MTLRGVPVLNFGSGGKAEWYALSNLFQPKMTDLMDNATDGFFMTRAELTPTMIRLRPFLAENFTPGRRLQFASIEAMWQGISKAKTWKMFKEFTARGRFGGLDSQGTFFRLLFPMEKAVKKLDHWRAKRLGGIVCKMTATASHAKKLGISVEDFNYEREGEFLSPVEEKEIWMALLKIKYTQNNEARNLLLNTHDEEGTPFYLLETARVFSDDDVPHWGGRFREGQNQEDGYIQGENVMGLYLMEMRALLANPQ